MWTIETGEEGSYLGRNIKITRVTHVAGENIAERGSVQYKYTGINRDEEDVRVDIPTKYFKKLWKPVPLQDWNGWY